MDFVIRDAYFCGTAHLGTIAHDRIIAKSSIVLSGGGEKDPKGPSDPGPIYTLAYKFSCVNDIIHALDGRRYMYHDIYFHDIAVMASVMVNSFLSLAVDELGLVGDCLDMELFVNMDEQTLAGRILALPASSPARIAFIRFRNRVLPRLVSSEIVPMTNESCASGVYYVGVDGGMIETVFYTRPFTGVDPKKFDYYNIAFLMKDGSLLSCTDAISSVGFIPLPAYRKRVSMIL
jgi:hypothetical protein